MRITLTTNDLLAVGGAAAAVLFLGFVHWALPGVAVGLAVSGVGLWRHTREPADRTDRPA